MKFYFCPKCGGGLDNKNKIGGDYVPKCKKCGFLFFQNSKPTGSVIPMNDNKIMLAKRGVEPKKGKYDVIGGFLKEDEDPVLGAKREFLEETGCALDQLSYLGTYIGKYGEEENLVYTFNVIYTCVLPESLQIKPADDVVSLEWFNLNDFDKKILAFPYLETVLKDLINTHT